MKRYDSHGGNGFVRFLKKNVVYVVIAAFLFVVGAIITIVALTGKAPTAPVATIDKTDNDNVIEFALPMQTFEVGLDYKVNEPVYSSTLDIWEYHKGIDLITESGTAVKAVYDGVIEEIDDGELNGGTVIISHGNGLKTVYKSLELDQNMKKGQSVKKGDTIGKASTSSLKEFKEGVHVHFEVLLNDKNVNPHDYLDFGNK